MRSLLLSTWNQRFKMAVNFSDKSASVYVMTGSFNTTNYIFHNLSDARRKIFIIECCKGEYFLFCDKLVGVLYFFKISPTKPFKYRHCSRVISHRIFMRRWSLNYNFNVTVNLTWLTASLGKSRSPHTLSERKFKDGTVRWNTWWKEKRGSWPYGSVPLFSRCGIKYFTSFWWAGIRWKGFYPH